MDLDVLIKKLDFKITDILYQVLIQDDVQDIIIQLNQGQLQQGKDNKGEVIRTYKAKGRNVYADFTIFKKLEQGDPMSPPDKVTLYSTGGFYNSFFLDLKQSLFKIKADFRDIGKNLDIDNILGLDMQSVGILMQQIIIPRMQQIIKNR